MDKKFQQKLARPRLLLIGCGDVGMRMLPLLTPHFRVFAVLRDASRIAAVRAAQAIPVLADLDDAHSLPRLRHLAQWVVHLAPPPSQGLHDLRTRRLCAILPAGVRLVYVSTSGVYGDCGGALIDETQTVAPVNARAKRRVDAEQVLRHWARTRNGHLSILRVPGIYASDRLPLARLEKALPALLPEEDVLTNHIHADDLARIVVAAMFRARPLRVYHAVDNSHLKMGEYFDLVADAFALPRPPRLPRSALAQYLSPAMLSFMGESRRLANTRLHQELRLVLRYPDVASGLSALRRQDKS